MKANEKPVRTVHGCTFCPSSLSLHNSPCSAYGASEFHKFYWDSK